jgi:mRNA interferase MazF
VVPALRKSAKDGAPTVFAAYARSKAWATPPIAYLSTVTVAPVTSTIRGVPSEVVLNEEDGMKSPCAVNPHNAVTVSQQRLGKRVAQLSSARMNEVCAALRFSLGCDSN